MTSYQVYCPCGGYLFVSDVDRAEPMHCAGCDRVYFGDPAQFEQKLPDPVDMSADERLYLLSWLFSAMARSPQAALFVEEVTKARAAFAERRSA